MSDEVLAAITVLLSASATWVIVYLYLTIRLKPMIRRSDWQRTHLPILVASIAAALVAFKYW